MFEEARVSTPPPEVWGVSVVIDDKPLSRAIESAMVDTLAKSMSF